MGGGLGATSLGNKSIKMLKTFLIIAFILFLLEPILSDTWIPKGPTCYKSVASFYFAEIFPAHSRINNEKPMCYFYKTNPISNDDMIYEPEKMYSLIWKGELVNDGAPNTALISPNGYLVTIDEHGNLGFDHSLVIYNKEGQVVKDFNVTDLIPSKDVQLFTASTSSIYWRNDAKYFFINLYNENESMHNPSHLYIILSTQKVIEISLDNGFIKYGDVEKFKYANYLNLSNSSNERAYFRESSLDFSSLTELLDCKINK